MGSSSPVWRVKISIYHQLTNLLTWQRTYISYRPHDPHSLSRLVISLITSEVISPCLNTFFTLRGQAVASWLPHDEPKCLHMSLVSLYSYKFLKVAITNGSLPLSQQRKRYHSLMCIRTFFPLIQRQDTPNNTDNLYIDHPALSQIPVLSALGCSAIHEKILSDTHAQGCATRKSKFDIIELQIDIT